jgi:hypothetical protein
MQLVDKPLIPQKTDALNPAYHHWRSRGPEDRMMSEFLWFHNNNLGIYATGYGFMGFGWSTHMTSVGRTIMISIPSYAPTAASLIYPLFCLLRIWRRRKSARRSRLGLCANCSYNLTAHKAGDKCPECGSLIPQPKNTATDTKPIA